MKKRKPAATLFDEVYRATFDKVPPLGWKSPSAMRAAIVSARRFVLDDAMSTFLADLATEAFVERNRSYPLKVRMLDQLRTSARLPHAATWVEYNHKLMMKRHRALMREKQAPQLSYGEGTDGRLVLELADAEEDPDAENTPTCEGWLLQQHPAIETAFRATIFVSDPHFSIQEGWGYNAYTMPISLAWTADDAPIPWRGTLASFEDEVCSSEVVTGLGGYRSKHAGITIADDLIEEPRGDANRWRSIKLLMEWAGTLRRIWAFLATINDLPIGLRRVESAKGFVARGSYRHFLSHSVVTLTVPAAESRRVARAAIAIVRRRAHQVRGHWRRDWRHPGERLWIKEHQRGDASLGFVTHDYVVERGGD